MANEFKIKNGAIVAGSITGITEPSSENSAKMASTSWVRNHVAANAGSISSTKTLQSFTATAGQTSFTITNGYTPGLLDIYLNGSFLNTSEYTATDGSTLVLTNAASLDDVIDVVKTNAFYVGASPNARESYLYTATASQTTFAATYTPGQVDVFYNGSKLAPAEFTATNGTSVVLTTAATSGDVVEIMGWLTGGGLTGTRTLTINGTSYDLSANRSWTITDDTKLPLSGGTLTGALVGTSVTLSSSLTFTSLYGGSINGYDGTSLVPMKYTASQHQWYADGTLKMALLGNGNLLLGTVGPDPGYRLDVNGTARVAGAATFSSSITATSGTFSGDILANGVFSLGGGNVLLSTDKPHFFRISGGGLGISANNEAVGNQPINFYTSGSTRFTIAASGNLGVSTTSPTGKLHVVLPAFTNEDTDGQQAIFGSGTNGYGVRIGYNESNSIGYIYSLKPGVAWSSLQFAGNNLIFCAGGSTEAMRINASRYLGIGTNSPTNLLTIANNSAGTNGIDFQSYASSQVLGKIYYEQTNDTFRIVNRSSYATGGIVFITNGDSNIRLQITSGGVLQLGNAAAQNNIFKSILEDTTNYQTQFFNSNSKNTFQIGGGSAIGYNEGAIISLMGSDRYGPTSAGVATIAAGNAVNNTNFGYIELKTANVQRLVVGFGGNVTHISYNVGEGILSKYNPNGTAYGFFNAGNSSFVLTNSGVANVGYFAMSSGNYVATSDRNKKKDFEVSTLGLAEVLQLVPTLYRFKTEGNNTPKHLGFIAQDVKDVVPPAYKEEIMGSETFIGLENTAIIPVLVKAVQELKAENDQLKDILTRNNIN